MGGHQSRFEEVDGEYLARPSTRLQSQGSGRKSKRKPKHSAERAVEALTIENNARKAAKALRTGKLRVCLNTPEVHIWLIVSPFSKRSKLRYITINRIRLFLDGIVLLGLPTIQRASDL